ncbi:MAG: hypothetical protein HY788_22575 [Deltaproteobacteria bacterium]|nr:hypothetical protein [Deltaproteobacteria bacterium]
MVKRTGQNLVLKLGYALVRNGNGHSEANSLYHSLHEAQKVATGALSVEKLPMMQEFVDIVEQPSLNIVYQPIVDLRALEPLGWEALARGPEDSVFHSPAALSEFAEEFGFLFQLERVYRPASSTRTSTISIRFQPTNLKNFSWQANNGFVYIVV